MAIDINLINTQNALSFWKDSPWSNERLQTTVLSEPQLGKRGLYPSFSTKESRKSVRDMMNLIAYSDGTNDLIAIADIIGVPVWELLDLVHRLKEENLLKSIIWKETIEFIIIFRKPSLRYLWDYYRFSADNHRCHINQRQ